uniref:GcrA cell cycle regulator n=1 Tax=Caulobacter sp. (strain K31) TaxID=366602 RepID=B0T9B8_CAUSK
MSSSCWSPERVQALRGLWGQGQSAAQIAKALGGVTRNAVIGKVHRLGLAKRASPAPPQAGAAPQGTAVSKPQASRSPPLPSRRPTSGPRRPPTEPPRPKPPSASASRSRPALVVEAVAQVFDAAALTAHVCRWPIGDPRDTDFGYCAAPATGAGPYCLAHHQRAHPPRRQGGDDRHDRRPAARVARTG